MTGRPDRDGTFPAAVTPATSPQIPGQVAASTPGSPPVEDRPPAATRVQLTVPALLSVTETAEVLGCSPRSVRRRIALGLLPAVRELGHIKVRGDDLAAYIDGLERHGPPPGTRRTRRRRHDYSFLTE